MNNGTLKSNFNDEDVLTWELKGDTLTFYEHGKIDDIVYLQIINKNNSSLKVKQPILKVCHLSEQLLTPNGTS